uniref:Amidohydrolase-related domain-containing protein n=1 Tax=Amphimedon queenslandica TaxID=400682 RepID=A0A1X7U045_AMPQE
MDASTRAASTIIEAEEVVLPGGELKKGPVYVSIVQDTITDITSTRPPTVKDVIKTHLLTPGFIDLHIHGLGGTNDVIDFWSNPGYTLSRLPMGGTTSCLATIVLPKSSSQPNTLQLFDKLKDVIGRTDTGGAVLEGINAEVIGIKPSLGHDKEASESEILDALRLSKEPMHITHLFNVCSFHHRLPGLVNIGLASVYPNLPEYTDIIPPTFEVIGDLAHVVASLKGLGSIAIDSRADMLLFDKDLILTATMVAGNTVWKK